MQLITTTATIGNADQFRRETVSASARFCREVVSRDRGTDAPISRLVFAGGCWDEEIAGLLADLGVALPERPDGMPTYQPSPGDE